MHDKGECELLLVQILSCFVSFVKITVCIFCPQCYCYCTNEGQIPDKSLSSWLSVQIATNILRKGVR